jgi:two-component system, NarL family, nitrate/nitrite response regulator NarL
MGSTVAITLVGQNDLVREGLRRLLLDNDFEVVQSVQGIPNVRRYEGDEVHIIVMDHGGARDVEVLRGRFPVSRIVVLSEFFDYEELWLAFSAGADAVIIKEISCKPLMISLRLVAAGEKVLPTQLAGALPRPGGAPPAEPATILEEAHLSERERAILRCLVMGWQNKVISRHLSISEATVKVHVKAILRKLRVQNRTQAAMRAVTATDTQEYSGLADGGGFTDLKLIGTTLGRA